MRGFGTDEGEGVQNPENLADVICEQPLTPSGLGQSVTIARMSLSQSQISTKHVLCDLPKVTLYPDCQCSRGHYGRAYLYYRTA